MPRANPMDPAREKSPVRSTFPTGSDPTMIRQKLQKRVDLPSGLSTLFQVLALTQGKQVT